MSQKIKLSLLALLACVRQSDASPVKLRGSNDHVIQIDLSSYYNNKAFGSKPGEARFGALNESYPLLPLGQDGEYTSIHSGIPFQLPQRGPEVEADNLICDSQEIAVPTDRYVSASFLIATDLRSQIVTGNVSFNYTDDSSTMTEMRSQPWWTFLAINRGEITFPYSFTSKGTNNNASHIYEFTAALDATRKLSAITLPSTTNATSGRLHVFAVSLWKGHGLAIQSVRPTQKWDAEGNQVVEVTVNNAGSECISGEGLTVSLKANGVTTSASGHIKRLCPGDQKSVDISVRGAYNGTVEVSLDVPGRVRSSFFFDSVEFGLEDFTPSPNSLSKHETPQWYNDAKFGIFIHYGPYAVPGWGNSTPYESYSEWFWWYSTRRGVHEDADRSSFYEYRLRTFGPDWNYDDSFPNYTASAFDPKEWVDLFADAGAGYFVFTTKHHDGFANFDAGNTTNRSAMHYGPKRDILGDLFEASEKYQPQLKRGTYFSIPECEYCTAYAFRHAFYAVY